MNRLLRIFITIVGMIVVIVFSMNSVLFLTHPHLSYGVAGMYHISLIFMLISLGILFFLTKFFQPYQNDYSEKDQSVWAIIMKHDIVILNIISSLTLVLYFITNQIQTMLPIIIMIIAIVFVSILWSIFILKAHLNKKRSIQIMLQNYISNIIFSAMTTYLFIELFLYFNLN
ncbi:MAG: hypothetical protein Q7I99_07915 [Acholeplasmataceae bacterium]|nr:hypothetical protein [Acholeplasmataceae bacterium]